MEDAKRVQELAGNQEVSRTTLNILYPLELASVEEWISTVQQLHEDAGGARYCIEIKDTGEMIGSIGLTADKRHNRASLGFWIGQDYWGRGYCTEACRKLIEFGFSKLGYLRIHADHFLHNPASGRVLQKSGMTHEGTLRDHLCKDGKYYSIEYYAIVNGDPIPGT